MTRWPAIVISLLVILGLGFYGAEAEVYFWGLMGLWLVVAVWSLMREQC